MSEQIREEDMRLWDEVVESHLAFVSASAEFLRGDVDRVSLMRSALRRGARATALYLAPYLSAAEKQALFEEWLFLASFDHGSIQLVREIIVSLPRGWVVETLRSVADDLLANADSVEYRRYMELFFLLDKELTRDYARRALTHPDEEVRELGEDFLEKLASA